MNTSTSLSRANSAPGHLIVVEGPNFSGKSSFIKALTDALAANGQDVVHTFEPGGTEFGDALRAALKTIPGVNDFARVLAMNASRVQKAVSIIKPALESGQIVLCDRYWPSTLVFQDHMGNLCDEERGVMNTLHRMLPVPALTIFLLPSAEVITQRASQRKDSKDVFEGRVSDEHSAYCAVIEQMRTQGHRVAVLDTAKGTPAELAMSLLSDPQIKALLYQTSAAA